MIDSSAPSERRGDGAPTARVPVTGGRATVTGMRSRSVLVIAMGAVAAVALAGCGSSSTDGADDDSGAAPTVTVTTGVPDPATAPSPAAPTAPPAAPESAALAPRTAAAVRALDAAAAAVPDGRPYDLERDDDDDDAVWKITVASGGDRPHELDVSADGRRIVGREREDRDDDAADALRAGVTLAQALRIADGRTPGHLDDAEIDREDGRLVWTVQFDEPSRDRDHEVTVDATTGEVVAVEIDDD